VKTKQVVCRTPAGSEPQGSNHRMPWHSSSQDCGHAPVYDEIGSGDVAGSI
jgi:hypothetical protein